MKKIKDCKFCSEPFEARRSNHVYCTPSCKTKASYKRNDYKYVSGHYKKQEDQHAGGKQLMVPDVVSTQIESLEEKITSLQENIKRTVNCTEITNAAIGTAAANATIHGLKQVFAPNTLPATKRDIDELKKELNNLKSLIRMNQMVNQHR
jgi:uncharacterized protein (DUF4213/DUF364 family)